MNQRDRLLLFAAATSFVSVAARADLGHELFKIVPGDGATNDNFGFAVAVDGTTAIIGSPGDSNVGSFSGSAYVIDTVTGQELFKCVPAESGDQDVAGYSVAISGTTAIVGSPLDDDNGSNSGSAYLFDTTTGQQIRRLLPLDGARDDRFAWSVGISGTIAVAGAYNDNDLGTESGSAYLFDTTTGQQLFKLLADDGQPGDHFGRSVAISGTIAIVGAEGDDDNGLASGAAYLFDTTTGLQIAKLLADSGAQGDWFGWSVAISGNTAIVGAPQAGPVNRGSAYVFDVAPAQQRFGFVPPDGAVGGHFGWSVGISGGTAIIGAPSDDDNGGGAGAAHLFDTDSGQWLIKILPADGAPNDIFGNSVAITAGAACAGAYYDDDMGNDSGSAYLFDASGAPCPEDVTGDGVVGFADILAILGAWGPCGGCPEDVDGSGSVGFADLLLLLSAWGAC